MTVYEALALANDNLKLAIQIADDDGNTTLGDQIDSIKEDLEDLLIKLNTKEPHVYNKTGSGI